MTTPVPGVALDSESETVCGECGLTECTILIDWNGILLCTACDWSERDAQIAEGFIDPGAQDDVPALTDGEGESGELLDMLDDYAARYIKATRGEDMSLEEMLISKSRERIADLEAQASAYKERVAVALSHLDKGTSATGGMYTGGSWEVMTAKAILRALLNGADR